MYTNQLKSVHVQACHMQEKVAHHSVIHLVLCTTLQVQSNVMNATGVVWCVCAVLFLSVHFCLQDNSSRQTLERNQRLTQKLLLFFS